MRKRNALLVIGILLFTTPIMSQVELVKVRLHVALIGKDLNLKPVPRLAIRLRRLGEAAPKETISFKTSFDGQSAVEIPPGQYQLSTPEPVEFQGRRYSWNLRMVAHEDQRVIELSNDNATIEGLAEAPIQEIASSRPQRRIAEETILFQRLRNGVVTIEAEGGKGSGFIVDPRGIVLTNQHVISGSLKVRVLFDDKRKVEAKILAADPQTDIAALWVNLDAFPEYVVLPLAKSGENSPTVVEGEKILAIGSPLSRTKIMTVGIVSKVEDTVIFSDVNINPGNSGGPSINSLGEVVGINSFVEHGGFGPGISGIIRIDQASAVLQEAEDKIASVDPPSAELLPVVPDRKFPVEGLARAITDEDYEPKHYQFDTKQYEVMIITPVLKWYAAESTRIEAARRKFKERRKKSKAISVTFDPFRDMKNYQQYLGDYDPTVQILATPKLKETKKSRIFRSVMAGLAGMGGTRSYMPGRYVWDAEFYEMKLLCDEREVTPIKRGRIEQVGSLPSYYGRDAHYTYQGYYTFPFEVFDPASCSQLKLEIYSEEDPTKAETKILEEKLLGRVWADFAEHVEALQNEEIETTGRN